MDSVKSVINKEYNLIKVPHKTDLFKNSLITPLTRGYVRYSPIICVGLIIYGIWSTLINNNNNNIFVKGQEISLPLFNFNINNFDDYNNYYFNNMTLYKIELNMSLINNNNNNLSLTEWQNNRIIDYNYLNFSIDNEYLNLLPLCEYKETYISLISKNINNNLIYSNKYITNILHSYLLYKNPIIGGTSLLILNPFPLQVVHGGLIFGAACGVCVTAACGACTAACFFANAYCFVWGPGALWCFGLICGGTCALSFGTCVPICIASMGPI